MFNNPLQVEIQAGSRADLKRGDVVEAVPRNRNVIKKQKKYVSNAASEMVSNAAPESVDDLSIIPGALGAEEVVVSFTAPEFTMGGESLGSVIKANIYRDEELIHDADVQPGQLFEWKDSEVTTGTHTYVVACENEKGEGNPTSKTVYVGHDLPGLVRELNVEIADNGLAVNLSWQAPDAGANEGYFTLDDVTYAVLRSYDGDNFYVIEDDLTGLSYKDADIEKAIDEADFGYQQGIFYYAVAAVNKVGNGSGESHPIVVGKPYKIPMVETFCNPFDVNPWSAISVIGYFGFLNMSYDEKKEIYTYDGVDGFNKFYSPWGESEVDSRLISPMVDLSDAEKPVVSFFMYHWNVADIDPSGQNTYLTLEVSEDGGNTFTSLCEPIMACSDKEGWVEHRISLEEYKGKTPLSISFRGYMDCNWMYYYIDEIHVEEQPVKDLGAMAINAPNKVDMNESVAISFTYYNRGTETVSDYTLDLYLGDELLQSLDGEPINYGEQKTVEYTHLATAAYAGRDLEYHVEISYADDENKDNNISTTVTTAVGDTWYPVAEALKAVCGNGKISVQWAAPELPDTPVETTDGAEDYEPFAISDFGNWLVYDGDQRRSGGFANLPRDPYYLENKAFQIWSPYYLTPDTTDWENNFPYLLPHTGDQCFISWYANLTITEGGVTSPEFNDDWLISEEISGGSDLSFYIKKIDSKSTAEDPYEVLYSSTDREAGSFEKIDGGIAGTDWELKEVTLPENARYFAIRNYANPREGKGIMVDDITFTSAIYGLEVEGYNVFRDGQKLNAALLESPSYEDTDVSDGETYEYSVSVVFNRGESVVCDPVSVTYINSVEDGSCGMVVKTTGNTLTVETAKEERVTVYKADGSIVSDTYTEGNVAVFQLENGVYVVKVGNEVTKAVI